MWALGVWLRGQISSLIEAARASLTTAINTRATPANVTAAQTALTTTINTRATPANVTAAQTAITNHVTNHVNSRTVAGGQPEVVRSLQRGQVQLSGQGSADITIAAVNRAKALTTTQNIATSNARSSFVSDTLIRVFGLVNSQVSWEVVEYF